MNRTATKLLLTLLLAAASLTVVAQDADTQLAARKRGDLSAAQQADFAASQKSFAAGQYADALVTLKDLHERDPFNNFVAKYAAEAAIATGDYTYAAFTLVVVLAQHDNDWQARAMLVRCDAQEGRDKYRDAGLARLTAMYASTTDPALKQLTQFLVEQVATSKGSLQIFWSLKPYSGYNVYLTGKVLDPADKRTFLITLESNDAEQPAWAQKHPQLAAAGERFYSLDGYRDDVAASGQVSQTHFTFAFFEDGRPTYNVLRQKMIVIAEGNGKPISSRSGLPAPK